MRINSISQVSQLYQTNATNKKKNIYGANAKDTVSISDFGKDYQIAKAAAANVPDVRQEKVDSLKQSIKNGTYEVSGEAFAEKLLAAYNEKNI